MSWSRNETNQLREIAETFSEQFKVSRETATMAASRALEAVLRHGHNEQAVRKDFAEIVSRALKEDAFWAEELIGSTVRVGLPAWEKAYRRAVKASQDPATALALETGVSMNLARAYAATAQRYASGTSMAELVREQVELARNMSASQLLENLDLG